MVVDVLDESSLGVSLSVTQFFVGLLECDVMCRDDAYRNDVVLLPYQNINISASNKDNHLE